MELPNSGGPLIAPAWSGQALAQVQQVEGTIRQFQNHLSQLKLYSQITEEDVEADALDETLHLLEEMEDGSCWLPSKGRVSVGVLDTCDDGYVHDGPMCFEAECEDGYEMGMGHCLEECDVNEIAKGLECFNVDDDSVRERDDYNLAFAPLSCADGLEQYANQCYAPCEDGWHGI